ncbi:hypothetical protein H9651_12655 [Microbacterium sp. Sa4CUA7]|uniref:Uncharacterized protein n=1 Tax=Microbacterium pullorum TaxID=2762236 RepID=A0ABR8S4T9_9MICO|nr:hypothetical protein [Microbacterium pullorum]MBD7958492.1 hypothetical protein [Microbacterium pullorum]
MSKPTASASFDARPLTEPVTRADVRAFTRELHASGRAENGVVSSIVALVVVAAFFIGALVFEALSSGASSSVGLALSERIPSMLFLLGIGLVGIVALVISRSGAATRRYRLDCFARANGMSYLPRPPGIRSLKRILAAETMGNTHCLVRQLSSHGGGDGRGQGAGAGARPKWDSSGSVSMRERIMNR